jgi:acyl-CoA thioester hydrolase
MSEEGTFFSFEHNFYNSNGQNVARCEMMGAWMNLKTRKLSSLPKELLVDFSSSNKTIDFKTLKASDTRKHGKMPKNLK